VLGLLYFWYLAVLTAETASFTVLHELSFYRSQKLRVYNDTLYIAMDVLSGDWVPNLRCYNLSDPLNPLWISELPLKVWDFLIEKTIYSSNPFSMANSACSCVVSKTGIGESSDLINSGISVHPNITPSAPFFWRFKMICL